MSKRKTLSKKARFEVFKRDEFTCQYCGATPPKVILHVDHITPVAGGGQNDMDNLITSCQPCNQGKGAASLSCVPQSLKDKAETVKEREEQIRGYSEVMAARRERLEDESWQALEEFMRVFRTDSVSREEFASVKRFVETLGIDTVIWAVDLALARKPYYPSSCFRYFCGICWNKVRGGDDG